MSNLETVRSFVVPPFVIEYTDEQLRTAGRECAERFVLWSGNLKNDHFVIQTAHSPRQTAYRFPDGICIRVDGEELHRLNVWLFENRQQLGVQVHSHPTEAFHSQTDNEFPIVTAMGGLSLVVPYFGCAGVRGDGTAWYRLGPSGWKKLSSGATKKLITLQE